MPAVPGVFTDSQKAPPIPCSLPQQIPAQVNRCEEDVALSPLVDDTADGRQPVDAEGVLSLPRDHGWDWDGRRLLALAPALVHQVQVAMHPGHLVGGEGVGAVIIWGNSGQDEGGRDQLALSLIPKSSFGEPWGHLGDTSTRWLSCQGWLVSCVPRATRWHCLSSSTAPRLPRWLRS